MIMLQILKLGVVCHSLPFAHNTVVKVYKARYIWHDVNMRMRQQKLWTQYVITYTSTPKSKVTYEFYGYRRYCADF